MGAILGALYPWLRLSKGRGGLALLADASKTGALPVGIPRNSVANRVCYFVQSRHCTGAPVVLGPGHPSFFKWISNGFPPKQELASCRLLRFLFASLACGLPLHRAKVASVSSLVSSAGDALDAGLQRVDAWDSLGATRALAADLPCPARKWPAYRMALKLCAARLRSA